MKIDWTYIEQTVLDRYKETLCLTPQSNVHHAEGDVLTHTRMVCEALTQMPEYQAQAEDVRHILYVAALLHDIGKIPTTQYIDGDWHAPHHAPVGSRMARQMLWRDYGLGGQNRLMEIREAICLLIRYHSFPPVAILRDEPELRLHQLAACGLTVPDFTIRSLCLLGRADAAGRRCADRQEFLDRIEFCEEMAREEGCYEGCYRFPSPHTRRAYLSGRDVWKGQELYDDSWGEVVMMSGLPGTGKDTWIRENLPGLPMISLDHIRRTAGIPPTAVQGWVGSMAREQAKEYLRQHQPFVWNATNITPQMRESLVSLFEAYHARVRIVYLETDWQTLLVRNASREEMVPQKVIANMLNKMSPPEAFEARTTELFAI